MENRTNEFEALKQDYPNHEMPPEQLDKMKAAIAQAKKENQKKRSLHILRNTLASAAAVALVFIILPNTSSGVAYAMSQVPGLSKLVNVVTFRDYQYEDDHNTADITVPKVAVSTESTENSEVADKTKKSADEINSEIQSITEKLIDEFEAEKKNEDGYQDMTVKSEVIATTDQYFTLKLMCFQSAGSSAEWDYYYTIDLTTGERLKLADLFQDGSNYLDVISQEIKNQMQAQMDADSNKIYWLNSDMPEWDFTSITDDTSFYLNSDNELVIAFNEGDVAPMYMGCPTFTIPNDVLADIRK